VLSLPLQLLLLLQQGVPRRLQLPRLVTGLCRRHQQVQQEEGTSRTQQLLLRQGVHRRQQPQLASKQGHTGGAQEGRRAGAHRNQQPQLASKQGMASDSTCSSSCRSGGGKTQVGAAGHQPPMSCSLHPSHPHDASSSSSNSSPPPPTLPGTATPCHPHPYYLWLVQPWLEAFLALCAHTPTPAPTLPMHTPQKSEAAKRTRQASKERAAMCKRTGSIIACKEGSANQKGKVTTCKGSSTT